jgi:adenylate cyclase class IV
MEAIISKYNNSQNCLKIEKDGSFIGVFTPVLKNLNLEEDEIAIYDNIATQPIIENLIKNQVISKTNRKYSENNTSVVIHKLKIL